MLCRVQSTARNRNAKRSKVVPKKIATIISARCFTTISPTVLPRRVNGTEAGASRAGEVTGKAPEWP